MRKLGVIGIVVVALEGFLLGVSGLNTLVFSMQSIDGASPLSLASVLMGVVPTLAAVLFGLYLIYNRNYLAAKWFEDEDSPSLDPTALLRVVIVSFGVWFLLRSVSTAALTLGSTMQYIAIAGMGEAAAIIGDPWSGLFRLLGPAAEFVMGLVLIRRSAWISSLLERTWVSDPASSDPTPGPTCPSCGASYDPSDYRGEVDSIACSECGEVIQLDRA